MKRPFFLFVIFCLSAIPSYSQDRLITFENLSVKQGLSHHFTMIGALWVGNPGGLHRLNLSSNESKHSTISFTHYWHTPGKTSLRSNTVGAILRAGMLTL